ncbi:hypothetical protein SeMB42_g02616 [Synchytrium endobioticum]|uniref:Uncharacterized protein n=1 Tax=Synchytrium endobioticum TaxID=286115 RepID=A0A507DCS2_9FUNG|nr:hypothetical protein SeMB42_g02616 [Synchytrium endobioticum]
MMRKHTSYFEPPDFELRIERPILKRMMRHVIPKAVPLTLRDLLRRPSKEMSLETLKLHLYAHLTLCSGFTDLPAAVVTLREALNNLNMQYLPFMHESVVIPLLAEPQQLYRDRFQDLAEETYWETERGEVSLPQAPPTEEQLLHWIWLLRERRSALAQQETLESQFMVDNLAHMMRKHTSYFEPPDFELRIERPILKRMMRHVIPKAVPLTLRDLLRRPSKEMSLDTLKLHLEALKNLHMQYLPFMHESVVIPLLAEPQQLYRDRFQDLAEETYWETERGKVSLPQAPSTEEQLLHWIWLLRERRFQLAQRTLMWECDELDFIIKTRVKSSAYDRTTAADENWPDSILELMWPNVIPDEVGLTLRDLKTPPTDGMDLEMLACHWEALENLQEPLRLSWNHVPRVADVQQQYKYKIMAVAETAAFDKQGPYGRDNLLVPVIVSANIHYPFSTPAGYSAAPRAESVFSDRGLTGSSRGSGWYGNVVKTVGNELDE